MGALDRSRLELKAAQAGIGAAAKEVAMGPSTVGGEPGELGVDVAEVSNTVLADHDAAGVQGTVL